MNNLFTEYNHRKVAELLADILQALFNEAANIRVDPNAPKADFTILKKLAGNIKTTFRCRVTWDKNLNFRIFYLGVGGDTYELFLESFKWFQVHNILRVRFLDTEKLKNHGLD